MKPVEPIITKKGTWVFTYHDGKQTTIAVDEIKGEMYTEPLVTIYEHAVSITWEDGHRRVFPLYTMKEVAYVPGEKNE